MELSELKHTRILQQPHLHLLMTRKEFMELQTKKQFFNTWVQFYELKIEDVELNERVRQAFLRGIHYVKIDLEGQIQSPHLELKRNCTTCKHYLGEQYGYMPTNPTGKPCPKQEGCLTVYGRTNWEAQGQ